jgi:hypothetical protein
MRTTEELRQPERGERLAALVAPEAPVGIEPMNGGSAVPGEPLRGLRPFPKLCTQATVTLLCQYRRVAIFCVLFG